MDMAGQFRVTAGPERMNREPYSTARFFFRASPDLLPSFSDLKLECNLTPYFTVCPPPITVAFTT
jgi:hypothetical protein